MGSSSSSNSVPSSVDMVASQKNADLVNSQWQDYVTRIQPQESQLINQVQGNGGLNTSFLPKELADASTGVTNAYTSADGQRSRDLSRFGQNQTAEQTQAQTTQAGLSQAASAANANNTTIQNDQNLKNSIVSGGLGSVAGLK